MGFSGADGFHKNGSGGGGGGSYSLPKTMQVYLVDNATDQASMGGVANNVYITAQAAYDAAVTLSAGTTPVVIMVGKTQAANVGDITLTADWDPFISVEGLDPYESQINNIVGENAAGNAFSLNGIVLNNIGINVVNLQATGPAGNAGNFLIAGSGLNITTIFLDVTDVANVAGLTGFIDYEMPQYDSGYSYFGAISCSGPGPLGDIFIDAPSANIGTLSVNVAGTGVIVLKNSTIGTLEIAQTAGVGIDTTLENLTLNNASSLSIRAASVYTIHKCSFNAGLTIVNTNAATIAPVTVTDSFFSSLDQTNTASATYMRFIAYGCTFGTMSNVSQNTRLYGCIIQNTIASIGTSCLIINTAINCGPTVGGAAAITNAGAVSVTFNNSYFRVAPAATVTLVNNPFTPPTTRYVYLVQDASDLVKMGDRHENVYSTAQAAYDAANTIQVALGGANKVIIRVGNTTAATVGNIVLTANYNTNVEWTGLSANDSVIGTFTGNFTVNARFNNMTVGTMTTTTAAITITGFNIIVGVITTAGGGLTLTCRNSTTGNIVMTTTGAVATGNLTFTSCQNLTTGSITCNADGGNIGTVTFTSCANVTTGAVTRNNTSVVASFNIGAVSMTNCESIRIGTFSSGLAYDSGTGTIGGFNIGTTNQDISFTGTVSMTGYTAADPVDVSITLLTLNNCTFQNFVLINAQVAAYSIRGGTIASVTIDNCRFYSAVRLGFNPATPTTSALLINNTEVINNTGGGTHGIMIDVVDVTFSGFELNNLKCSDDSTGIALTNTNSTTRFTPDEVSAIISNCTSGTFSFDLNNAEAANTVYDAILLNNGFNGSFFSLNVVGGDVNFLLDKTNADNAYIIDATGTNTKRTIIETCNLSIHSLAVVSGQGPTLTGALLTLKNSFVMYYTDAANALDLIAYASFFESVADAATVTTFTGTLNTSVMRILVTDDTTGVTNNNSQIQTY